MITGKNRRFVWCSVIASSLCLLVSCKDRVFDNPFDPEISEVIFEVVNTIPTPSAYPLGLAWDGNGLWNVDGSSNTLYCLSRSNGAQIRALTSPLPSTTGIAYDGHDLWVCSETSVELYKINPVSGEIQKRLNLQRGSFTALAYGQGSLWIGDLQSNTIMKINPETGEIQFSFANPGVRVDGLTFHQASLWLSDPTNLTIYELTSGGSVMRRFLSPGQSPRGLASDGYYLWNADGSQKLYQLRVLN